MLYRTNCVNTTIIVYVRSGPIANSTQERADNGAKRIDSSATIHRRVEARVAGNREGNQGIAGKYCMAVTVKKYANETFILFRQQLTPC